MNILNINLQKILGESNIHNNDSSKKKMSNLNHSYLIQSNKMKIYKDMIDDELIHKMIEHDINIVEMYGKTLNSINNLPNNVNILILSNCNSTQLHDLPSSITHLYFLNLTGELNCLSNGVKVIYFGDTYNEQIKNLPNSVEEIILGSEFDKEVDYLPNNLKIIKFGSKFNQPINNLPSSLERIIFGTNFNHPIDNLPNSVLYIKFDWTGVFSFDIFRLPSNLEEIYFNNSFSNDICELPNGVKKILLGSSFSKPINLPMNLEKIELCSTYKYLRFIDSIIFNKNIIVKKYF